MKSEVKSAPKRARTYPYLGIYEPNQKVILFYSAGEGIVVATSEGINKEPIGTHGYWSEDIFAPFNGQVILEN